MSRLSEAAKDVAIASKGEHITRKDERIARLEKLVAALKQAPYGRKSDKTDPDQFDLALEEETAMAAIHAEDEADVPAGNRISKPRAINRGSLPKHLPRIEEVIEPESLTCVNAEYFSPQGVRTKTGTEQRERQSHSGRGV